MTARASVLEFLNVLWEPGDVREVRVPQYNEYRTTAAGWFDDPEKLADAALVWDGRANIFVTLNPVDPELLARANNRILSRSTHTSADVDVVARKWLFIDIDAARKSGISSTDVELGRAKALAREVSDYLEARSWPDAVVAMSGNGYYLLYSLDLPHDGEAASLVERLLAGLAGRFNNDTAHIDTSVSNAARIIGLVGTLKVKGDETKDRPHRRSKLVKLPDSAFKLSAAELLPVIEELEAATRSAADGQQAASASAFSVEQMLLGAGVAYRAQPPDANGVTWYHVQRCPLHDDGRDFECGVGQKLPGGPAAGHCFHPEGQGSGWAEFRDALGLGGAAPARQTAKVAPLISLNSLLSHGGDRQWPDPPGDAAFHAFAGRMVEAIDPYTEADRVALLVNLLGAFGSAVGAGPHAMVGATPHFAREFFAIVGRTGKARKGDSWNPVSAVMAAAAPDWAERVLSGLSTGEGLIFQVRDEVSKQQPIKEKGRVVGYEDVVIDEGVKDKRLLVVESELAKVLKVMERQGNSLSPVIRTAWDHGTLRTLTKVNPMTATGAHISLIGHITVEELEKLLPDVEAANGFMNRFIVAAVNRSKMLPEPEPFVGAPVARLAAEIEDLLAQAMDIGRMSRTPAAMDLWASVYPDLSADGEGLAGALKARAEAHVLRLSMVYALLDGQELIDLPHLGAALELWAYADRSIDYVFGDASGNPVADSILRALRAGGELSRTEISNIFGRHESSAAIDLALQQLLGKGKVLIERRETGGRPQELWRAA